MCVLAGFERNAVVRVIGQSVLVAAAVGAMFTQALADPHPVGPSGFTVHVFGSASPPVVLSLSESNAFAYDHFSPSTAGFRDIYLWADCVESIAAVHATLSHGFSFATAFTPTPGIINMGSAVDVRLLMDGCVDSFPYLLGKFTVFDSGTGAWACLTPLPVLGTRGSADCSFPFPLRASATVRPFFAHTPSPMLVPCGIPRNCHQIAVSGRGLTTNGGGPGDYVAVGIKLPANSAIASVDWASVTYAGTDTPLTEIFYSPNATTASSFAAVEAGDWTAFFAVVSDSIPPDVAVDLTFDITPTPGATLLDVATVLQTCRIGTDHANSSGAILAGDDLDIVTPSVPVSVDTIPVESLRRLFHAAEPNPLNGATTLRFELPTSSAVTLRVFDVAGRAVRLLDTSERGAGIHTVVWDGRDEKRGLVAPGIYFAELSAGDARETQKLTVIR